jgi:hypothetical protein
MAILHDRRLNPGLSVGWDSPGGVFAGRAPLSFRYTPGDVNEGRVGVRFSRVNR